MVLTRLLTTNRLEISLEPEKSKTGLCVTVMFHSVKFSTLAKTGLSSFTGPKCCR